MMLLKPNTVFNRAYAYGRSRECFEQIAEWVEKFREANLISEIEYTDMLKKCREREKECPSISLDSNVRLVRDKWWKTHYEQLKGYYVEDEK